MVDADLTSPDAKVFTIDYQTAATDADGLKGYVLSKGKVLEAIRVAGLFSDIYL
jgi:hypothetical protein